MKKQLLAAAVAATMASVASADISISGSAKANYTNTDSTTDSSDTNTFSTEINLGVVGKTGDSSVVVNLQTKNQDDQSSSAASRGFDIQDSYVTSKIGDAAVKMGNWRGSHNLLEDGDSTSLKKFEASMDFSGIKVKFADQQAGSESVTLSGTFNGVSVSHKMANTSTAGQDKTDTSISGSFAGVDVAWRSIDQDSSTSNDDESFSISTTMDGVSLTYAQVEAGAGGSINSDGVLGDIDTHEAKGVVISTSIAGNKVKLRTVDSEASEGAADTSINTVIITRPLASGATFEATYTDKDNATGADTKALDLELAVKF